MTEAETSQLMAILKDAYPNQIITQGTIDVYAMMLADLDFQSARDAVRQLLTSCKFFPTIAEIRGAVVERRTDLPAAGIAWGEVQAAIRDVGFYRAPAWSSPVVTAAVAAIGWENICLCERDDLGTLRAQFQRIYDAYRQRTIQDENLAGLGLGRDRSEERLATGTEGLRRLGDVVPLRRRSE